VTDFTTTMALEMFLLRCDVFFLLFRIFAFLEMFGDYDALTSDARAVFSSFVFFHDFNAKHFPATRHVTLSHISKIFETWWKTV